MQRIENDNRYRGIPIEKVRRHFEVEHELRGALLSSKKEERAEVFKWAYSELFRRVPWHPALHELQDGPDESIVQEKKGSWLPLIGSGRQSVLEIGFGTGELLLALNEAGHDCTGLDVEKGRVTALADLGEGRLRIRHGDGTCPEFNSREFDVVISQQLFEHLHPDDVLGHLRCVRRILKNEGRYFLETPNRLFGPADVSRFFTDAEAQGFHLKEYSISEMLALFSDAEFSATQVIAWKKRIMTGGRAALLERLLSVVPRNIRHRHTMGLHNPIYVAIA